MQSNPLNIVDREWPDHYDILKPQLFNGINCCVAAHISAYEKTTSADVIVCSIYCVVDFLIVYKVNTEPLNILPLSIVNTMQSIAIEILRQRYDWFDEHHEKLFTSNLQDSVYNPTIIQNTKEFMKGLDLNP